MSSSIAKFLVAALAAGAAALPQPPFPTTTAAAAPAATSDNTALIQDLLDAPTAIDRFKKLFTRKVGDQDVLLSAEELQAVTVFDFNNAMPANNSKGGALKAANIKSFPILTDLGISVTMGFLNPCGMNTPHVHPRASEFLTVVDGSLDFGFIPENGLVSSGSSEVVGHLDKFKGGVFPMGSIHYQVNNECKPATFVAALNSVDPGTGQIAQNFFGLNGDVVAATLGFPEMLNGQDIEAFRNKIPVNVALGIEQCLKKCGIPKK